MLSNEQIAHDLAVAAAKIMLENRVRLSQSSESEQTLLREMANYYKNAYNQLLNQFID